MALEAHQMKCDSLEGSSGKVRRCLWKDRCFNDFIYRLKFDPNQPDKVTISGLAADDYPSLREFDVSEFCEERECPIPQELTDQLRLANAIYSLGLLPEISRAYMTIGADLYLWNYEDGCDLVCFDSISNAITKVSLARPKTAVFQDHIHYLLVVATSVDVLILALSFMNPSTATPLVSKAPDPRHSTVYLLPDPIFKIPLESHPASDIVTTGSGRIFFAESGSIYEIDYQDKSWFQRKCRKVNHSKSFIGYLLPSLSLFTGKEERIVRLCVDDTRHIVYSLSELGSIQVFDLGNDGQSMSKVAYLSAGEIQERAAVECRTVDPAFFAEVVAISAIPSTQSQYLHLAAVTRRGVRLYFTCYEETPQSAFLSAAVGTPPPVLPDTAGKRPCDLRLRHVRLPPGIGAFSVTVRPYFIYDSFLSFEVSAFAGGSLSGNASSTLWLLSSSNFQLRHSISENMLQVQLKGMILGIYQSSAAMSNLVSPRDQMYVRPPTVVFQHREVPGKLLVLSENGITMYSQRTPVNILREILRNFGAESPQAAFFFHLHGTLNSCVMALIILCADEASDAFLKDMALRVFFSLGAEVCDVEATGNVPEAMSPQRPTCDVVEWNGRNSSLPDLSFSYRSPLFMSTPQPRSPIPSPLNGTYSSEGLQRNVLLTQMKRTYGHEALFVAFSRIVGDLWTSPLCYRTEPNMLTSIFTEEELSWLNVQLVQLKKAIDDNGLIGNVNEIMQPFFARGDAARKADDTRAAWRQEERLSLLSFRELLSMSVEVLSLWRVLCEHGFHIVTSRLTPHTRARICDTHFSTIVVAGGELCGELITCLVRHYISDNAVTTQLCEELRRVCPSLFSVDDASAARAIEMLEEARDMEPSVERSQLVSDAVQKLIASVHKINLPLVCNLLYEVGSVEEIVRLVLARAERSDPKMLALIAYKSRPGESDVVAQEALSKRREAYKCLTDVLDRLHSRQAAKAAGFDGPSNTVSRDLIISSVFRSKDELANVTVYRWILDNNLGNLLLQYRSPFVESFLRRVVDEDPSSRYLDLLCQLHERDHEFSKAARLLYHLAQRDVSLLDVRRRLIYLSQAVMCARSALSNTTDSDSDAHDFLQELTDKVDVVRIQIATKEAVERIPANDERAAQRADALRRLDMRLYTVQELFVEFALPLKLAEVKLALCSCSDTYSKEVIKELCIEIIDQELRANEKETPANRQQRLGVRLAALCKHYSSTPKFFPIEVVLSEVISRSLSEGFATSAVDSIAHQCGTPFPLLFDILMSCFRNDPFWRSNENAGMYLMESAMEVFRRFIAAAPSLPYDQRKSASNKCLDILAAFSLHLASPHCSTANRDKRAQLRDTFKTLHNVFENI